MLESCTEVVSHASCDCDARLSGHPVQEGHEIKDQPMDVKSFLSVDSTLAIGFTVRRGPGSLKHMDLKYLSLQDDVREGASKVSHVSTDVLMADFLTKPCNEYKLMQFRHAINLSNVELTLEPELRELHL